jgi:plastocyanin
LALAACGTSASSGSGGLSESLTASNYQFSPASFSAPANSQVTVTIKNSEASTKHNFTIKEFGINEDLDAGQTVTKTFTVAGNATVTYYCEYHGDSKGMKGTLTVGSGGSGGSGGGSPPGGGANPTSSGGYHY